MSAKKHKKLYQRILLKALPCLLFLGAIFCFSYWFFQAKIVDSTIWSLLISSNSALSESGTVLNTELDKLDIQVEEETQSYNAAQFPSIRWGQRWATLSIPSQNVKDAPVFLGDGNDILNQMVIGQYFSSKYPGQGGKTVLNSHVSAAFHCLEDMKEGEQVILDTIYGQYVYEVTEIVIFSPEEESWVKQDSSGQETLFCYTCYPRAAAYRSQRIGILCTKVSGIPWQ